MVLMGGGGGVLGSMVGARLGRGGLIVGGVVGGVLFVVGAGLLSARWGWIGRPGALWTILGGAAGFGCACLVTFATLGSPVGPILSTLLIGTGAVLGAVVGRDPHTQS
jgi:hypothetical protein